MEERYTRAALEQLAAQAPGKPVTDGAGRTLGVVTSVEVCNEALQVTAELRAQDESLLLPDTFEIRVPHAGTGRS